MLHGIVLLSLIKTLSLFVQLFEYFLLQIKVCNVVIHLQAVWFCSWLITLKQSLFLKFLWEKWMGKIFQKPRLLKICTLLKAICYLCGVWSCCLCRAFQNAAYVDSEASLQDFWTELIFFSGEAADKGLVLNVCFTSQTLAVHRDLPPFAPHRS